MRVPVPALVVGLMFGAGLALSDMINPARVLAFLDLAGRWDPTLAFVMGSALIPSALGYRARIEDRIHGVLPMLALQDRIALVATEELLLDLHVWHPFPERKTTFRNRANRKLFLQSSRGANFAYRVGGSGPILFGID